MEGSLGPVAPLWTILVRGMMLTSLFAIYSGEGTSLAQTPFPFPPQPPQLPEQLPPPSTPAPVLPSAPPASEQRAPLPPVRVFVQSIQVIGSTVFSGEQLADVTKRYTGRELTAEDMEALRLELTLLYVNNGYVTSGAIIPDQTLSDTLTIQVVEGTLSAITVEGNPYLRSSYVRDRIERGVTKPLNVTRLQDRLQLLQRDPHIVRLKTDLKPGVALGESTLNVKVAEAPIFHSRLEFNNYQSPTVGAEQGLGTIEATNVSGFGDSLSFQYGRSSGVNPIINARYAIPLNRYDTTFSAQYRKFSLAVQDPQFEALDIRNDAEIIGFILRQPLYRTLRDEFAVSLIGEHEKSESSLLGQPFEFVAGATDGVFKVSALRFAQEFTHQTTQQVVSAFSRFSLGIGTLGATGSSMAPFSATGQFFSWLGTAQWVQQLQPLRTHMIARTTMQLSNEHLFPLEQIAVGGRYSVRGYREFTFVRDNGFLASLEFRVPVFTTADGIDRLHLAPFSDIGWSWNTSVPNGPDRTMLASVGIGLIATITRQSRFEIYWGQQLNHLRLGEGNLQDHGIHLQLVVLAF